VIITLQWHTGWPKKLNTLLYAFVQQVCQFWGHPVYRVPRDRNLQKLNQFNTRNQIWLPGGLIDSYSWTLKMLKWRVFEYRKRSCEYNLGGHCETENAASLAAQWHYLNSPWSPGRRKRQRNADTRWLRTRRPERCYYHIARDAGRVPTTRNRPLCGDLPPRWVQIPRHQLVGHCRYVKVTESRRKFSNKFGNFAQ